MDFKVEKVMDREKVASAIHSILTAGIELLAKKDYKPVDHSKIKVIRTMSSPLNAAVSMIQQETAQQRVHLVLKRMEQLGYENGGMAKLSS